MFGKLPWIVYQYLASILKKGGWPLVILLSGLLAKGTISTIQQVKQFVDNWKPNDGRGNKDT